MKITDLTLSKGQNYTYVNSNGTPAENAIAVQTAYSKASVSTPNGLALSSTNRALIVLAPGKYDFLTPFILSSNYVDITSSTGEADAEINNLSITANDVKVKGIYTPNFLSVGDNLTLLVAENCIGGGDMFGRPVGQPNTWILSGTFKNCKGAHFASGVVCSGTFINCESTGSYGFGGAAAATGLFINCNAFGGFSFGGGTFEGPIVDSASGTFINCTGTNQAFGGRNNASGVFINCKATIQSFAHEGTFSGVATNCVAGFYSFGGHYGGNAGTFAGKAYNCVAGGGSFGNTVLTGKLVGCSITEEVSGIAGTKNTFTTVTGAGKTVNCVDGNYATNNQG